MFLSSCLYVCHYSTVKNLFLISIYYSTSYQWLINLMFKKTIVHDDKQVIKEGIYEFTEF